MSIEHSGGAAFPLPHYHRPNGETEWGNEGMSLRDWFAGQAMIGGVNAIACGAVSVEQCAIDNYKYADAMLKARQQ